MAEVNVEDDSLRRFVVQHYRYDPERRQRRHVVVAAFDSESEFKRRIKELSNALKRGRESSQDFDSKESISGVVLEPGYIALQRNAHLLKQAIAHGTVPQEVVELPLPPNVALLQFDARHK